MSCASSLLDHLRAQPRTRTIARGPPTSGGLRSIRSRAETRAWGSRVGIDLSSGTYLALMIGSLAVALAVGGYRVARDDVVPSWEDVKRAFRLWDLWEALLKMAMPIVHCLAFTGIVLMILGGLVTALYVIL
jgi:hypothetical protein